MGVVPEIFSGGLKMKRTLIRAVVRIIHHVERPASTAVPKTRMKISETLELLHNDRPRRARKPTRLTCLFPQPAPTKTSFRDRPTPPKQRYRSSPSPTETGLFFARRTSGRATSNTAFPAVTAVKSLVAAPPKADVAGRVRRPCRAEEDRRPRRCCAAAALLPSDTCASRLFMSSAHASACGQA